jgi:regulator of sigma E protease
VYILLAILLLAILIVVHEFGHFMAARAMKIDVREFAVGFGPKLIGWKSKKYETTFAIRLIPMGGYCSFYGEDDATGISKDDPRNFGKHNVWKRMFVILMGPMMNFILAFVVGTVMLWCSGVTVVKDPAEYDPFIQDVLASGPAQEAGMKAGDEVLEINGKNMMDGTMDTLLNTISSWKEEDGPLNMKIRRNGEIVEASVTPAWNEEAQKMQIGVYISGYLRTEARPVGFFEGFAESGKLCWNASGAILRALKNLVTKGEGLEDTAGPVGIVSMISTQVEGQVKQGGVGAGVGMFTQLLVLISINLGLMNLLPIPGLDGSRLVFGIIEVIRKKPVPPQKEAIVHLVGMGLLLLLMVFFTFKDVIKLFR